MRGAVGDLPDEWLRRMRDAMVELLGRRTAPHLSGTLGDLADEVRTAHRSVGSAEERGRRLVEQSRGTVDGTGNANRVPAAPSDSRRTVDGSVPVPAQRRYPVDDYIAMWERRHGREMTDAERKVLGQGCIGIVKVRLGLLEVEAGPPANLAFADPVSHGAIHSVEKILVPGEIANVRVKRWRQRLDEAEALVAERGTGWSHENKDGTTTPAPEHIERIKKYLDRARLQARHVWSDIANSDIGDVMAARREARIESNQRAFDRVSNYAGKFEAIIATGPKDVGEFMRLVKADPDLALLRDVDRHLPSADPAEWKVEIYSKHFWSGQEVIRDSRGTPVVKEGVTGVRALRTPDSTLFAPDPATGQVDMSGDHNRGKPGFGNFDYALYDASTGSWWNANHGDWRMYPESSGSAIPMAVQQNSPEQFFSGRPDFDSSVICLGFARAVQ